MSLFLGTLLWSVRLCSQSSISRANSDRETAVLCEPKFAPPPPPIKIPGSAPVTDITSLTFIDNKSHDVPYCWRSLPLSFWVRRTKGGSPYKPWVQNCIRQHAAHAQQRYYWIHAESFPSTPNKWLQSAFPIHRVSYFILFSFHILFAQFFSLIACWACTGHYLSTKHSDHYTFLRNCPPTSSLSQHFALNEK